MRKKLFVFEISILVFALSVMGCESVQVVGDSTQLSGNGGESAFTWVPVQQSGSPYPMQDIAYGNGKFVAVGRQGSGNNHQMYSTDGITWMEDTDNAFGDIDTSTITFCGGKFFVSSYSGMFSSTDGENWTMVVSNPGSTIRAPAYGDGKWVFVTGDGRIMYSIDGVTLTAAAKRPSGFKYHSIAYGNGKFVALADDSKLAYSIDGINWTVGADTAFGSRNFSITYGNGKFVASGWKGIAYSTDGLTWTQIQFSEFGGFASRIVYGGGKFVAVEGDKMAYSVDGVTWMVLSDRPLDGMRITGIAYGGGRFVAVGNVSEETDEYWKLIDWKIAYSNMQE